MAVGDFATLNTGNDIKTIYPDEALEAFANLSQTVRPKLNKTLPGGSRVTQGVVKIGAYLHPANNSAQIPDVGTMPYPKDRVSTVWTITPTAFGATFQIGGVTLAAANSSKSAYNGGERARRVKETMQDVGKDMERIYISVVNGIRCYVDASTTSSNDFVARQSGPVQTQGTRLIHINDLLSVRTAADSGARDSTDGCKVTEIVTATRTVTLAADTPSLVAADPVYKVGDGASLTNGTVVSLSGMHANSIRAAVDDGSLATTWHAVTRSGITGKKAYGHVKTGAVRALDEDEIIDLMTEINDEDGEMPDTILLGYGLAKAWGALLAPGRRIVNDGKSLTGVTVGYDPKLFKVVLPWGTADVMVAQDVLPREMFLLNWNTFCMYQAKPMSWITEDNSSALKLIPGGFGYKFGFQGLAAAVENLICIAPSKNGVIRNIADPLIGDVVGTST
jgi:hypothetical protein